MSALVLPLVALLFIWAAVRRYRGDRAATAAGIVAGLGGTLGVALALSEISLGIPLWLLLVLWAVAALVAVAGSLYAEARRRHAVDTRTARSE